MDDKFVVPSFFSILEVILTALAVPSFPSSSNDFFQLGVSVGIYLFKFSNINFRTMYEICWTLTIETLERHHWLYSGIFISNFEQISYIVLVFALLTLNKQMPKN